MHTHFISKRTTVLNVATSWQSIGGFAVTGGRGGLPPPPPQEEPGGDAFDDFDYGDEGGGDEQDSRYHLLPFPLFFLILGFPL
jgi:hypothetical protein